LETLEDQFVSLPNTLSLIISNEIIPLKESLNSHTQTLTLIKDNQINSDSNMNNKLLSFSNIIGKNFNSLQARINFGNQAALKIWETIQKAIESLPINIYLELISNY
jgi:hypothetical protein